MTSLATKSQLRASLLRWTLFCVPLILLLGFAFGRLGGPDTVWFQSLTKPAIFPPPAAFGIVWSALYVMIGFALALVASAWGAGGRAFAIGMFALHFLFNLAWTPTFFAAQNMAAGLIVLGAAVATAIPVLIVFFKVRPLAGLLFLPYLAWLCFAAVLNYQFIAENPDGGAELQDGATAQVQI